MGWHRRRDKAAAIGQESAAMSAPSFRGRQRRLVAVALILLTGIAVAVPLVFRYRAIAGLGEALRQRAAADGVTVRFGASQVGLRETTLHDVHVAVARIPGLTITADTVTVRPGTSAVFDVAAGRVQMTVEATALVPSGGFARLGLWRALSLSWRHLGVTQVNRLTGPVHLDQVTIDRPPPAQPPGSTSADAVTLRAASVTAGSRRWSEVLLAVQRRGEMVELGLGAPTVRTAPVVIGVFPSQGGAWGIVGTVAHPPLPVLADALGLALGPAFAAARVGGSFSFTIPDDATRPVSGRLELLVSGWPGPADTDAAAVLGTAIGLGARTTLGPDRTQIPLESVRMSTSLFSLGGAGSLGLGRDLRLALDLSGHLTCAQIRGNLRPSAVLDAVSRYLGNAPSGDDTANSKMGRKTAARLRETVTMRVQLETALGGPAPARLAWSMAPGCGFAGFAFGTFAPAPHPH